jgi:hypothetical protein
VLQYVVCTYVCTFTVCAVGLAGVLWLQITKTADGYQPHLVSPERGLQLMASKALDQVEGPVQVRMRAAAVACLSQVQQHDSWGSCRVSAVEQLPCMLDIAAADATCRSARDAAEATSRHVVVSLIMLHACRACRNVCRRCTHC